MELLQAVSSNPDVNGGRRAGGGGAVMTVVEATQDNLWFLFCFYIPQDPSRVLCGRDSR